MIKLQDLLAETDISRDTIDGVTVYYEDQKPGAEFDHVAFAIDGKKVTMDDYSEAARIFAELMGTNRFFGAKLPSQYDASKFAKFSKLFSEKTGIDNIKVSEFFW